MTEERWQQLTYWPLVIASLAFLVAYSWQVIAELAGPARNLTLSIIFATWCVFVLDYIVRLSLQQQRAQWFRAHIFDLLVVVLPVLKPLRLLRVLTMVAALRRTVGSALRTRIIIYGSAAVLLLIWMGSLAVLEAERGAPGATIQSFGDAIWWAFVTITTVGYGDYTPVTVVGRLVAVALMLSGVAVLGITTATLSSWVRERISRGRDDEEAATRGQMRHLSEQVSALALRLGDDGGPDKV
ncbi:MAG TPA: ion channel [Microbacterium sp.]|uniref:potassium channel family protein n=1 Tax=Microbacterium sp. TaxID=51671 RepID=UPI002B6BD6D4|nr:ion channel [Microbacterium sp.]HWI31889.1 ion channel [Microbacterium sp.]